MPSLTTEPAAAGMRVDAYLAKALPDVSRARVQLLTENGQVTVDENYVRESILDPQAKIVTGYQGVMPTFRGQMSDADLDELIAYISSLKD